MPRLLSHLARAFWLLLALAPACAFAQVTGQGQEFWACWPRSHLSLETSAEVIVMSDAQTDVMVDGAFAAGPIRVVPGVPVSIGIPQTLRLASTRTVQPLAFRVRSLDPLVDISVLLRVPRQAEASDDMARLLPTNEAGTRYVVTAWQAALPGEPSYYVIVATEDGTNVDAEIPCAATTDRLVMNAGDTYQVLCNWRDLRADVTGAIVSSDRPVIVLAGNSNAYVPTTFLSGDFVIEAMTPTSAWASEFYVAPLPRGPAALPVAVDVVRLTASAPVNVTIEDEAGSSVVALAGEGSYADISLTSQARITADSKIAVHQFATGVEMSDMGDPFMTEIPPVVHWSSAVRAYIPPDYSLGSYLTIVTDISGTAAVFVGGNRVTTWTPFRSGTHAFSIVSLGLASGEFVVTGSSPLVVIAHGYNADYAPQPDLGRVPGSFGYPAPHVDPRCLVAPLVDAPPSACQNQLLTLTDFGTAIVNCPVVEFRWLRDGVPIPGCDIFDTDPECATFFDGQATYTLEARCQSDPSCAGSLPFVVLDLPAPPVVLGPDPALVCAGSPIELVASLGFSRYSWTSFPNDAGVTPTFGPSATLIATPDVDTAYSLTARDARGCPSLATIFVQVIPDPIPPPIDDSLRVTRTGATGVQLTWTDLTGVSVGDYEAVHLSCATRDYRDSCGGLVPDPITIQAAPIVGSVAPGVQLIVDPLAVGSPYQLIFYKVRATSPCAGLPGPTCNGFPRQLPPCP